jgi:hypothetical protein
MIQGDSQVQVLEVILPGTLYLDGLVLHRSWHPFTEIFKDYQKPRTFSRRMPHAPPLHNDHK